jgi:hypothetical protein
VCEKLSAMEQFPERNDPFKGFPFPKQTTLLQRHLYAGAKNICSGAFFRRKAAIQSIWQGGRHQFIRSGRLIQLIASITALPLSTRLFVEHILDQRDDSATGFRIQLRK